MSTAVTQLNTRIDVDAKREGDAVFARYGLTSSAVVRAVWAYAAKHQQPPEFMLAGQDGKGSESRAAAIREGAGMALRLSGEQGLSAARLPIDYAALRDELYDGLAKEYERHAKA